MKFKRISLKVFILLFGSLFFIKGISASTRTDTFKKEYISGYSYVDASGRYGNFEHFMRVLDDATVFCIEPGVPLANTSYNGLYNVSHLEKAKKVNLTEEVMKNVSFVAHFGWGYAGHEGEEWIVATQALIWQKLGLSFQFTSQNNPSEPWKYVIPIPHEIQEKMEEIERLISNYLVQPSFPTSYAKIPIETSYDFVDSKNVLTTFEVATCRNCFFTKKDNVLSIHPISNEDGYVLLSKRDDVWPHDYIVYYTDLGQNVIAPGNAQLVNMRIDFEVISGTFQLKKHDFESFACKPQEGTSLAGSVYNLYKEDGTFVKELVIDEDCNASISNLEMGRYYIKEKIPGKNYNLDSASYFFTIAPDYLNQSLTVYSRRTLGQVKLIKQDRDTNSCITSSSYATLKGAVYGLFKEDGTLLEKLITDEDCQALSKKSLTVGNYYLQEITPSTGYQLDFKKYPFTIRSEDIAKVVEIKVYETIYKSHLTLHKVYPFLQNLENEVGAKFVISSKKEGKAITTLITNDKGYAEVTLPYGEYIIKQISGKEGYHYMEDITFVVNEDTRFDTEIEIINKPFLGRLLFTKIDAITGDFLSDAFIEVYHESGSLIYQGKTNENGKVTLSELPYGNYYLKEIIAPEGYALSDEVLYFQIKADGDVVSLTLENEHEVYVPSTASYKAPFYSFVSLFLVVLGLGLWKYVKKV